MLYQGQRLDIKYMDKFNSLFDMVTQQGGTFRKPFLTKEKNEKNMNQIMQESPRRRHSIFLFKHDPSLCSMIKSYGWWSYNLN